MGDRERKLGHRSLGKLAEEVRKGGQRAQFKTQGVLATADSGQDAPAFPESISSLSGDSAPAQPRFEKLMLSPTACSLVGPALSPLGILTRDTSVGNGVGGGRCMPVAGSRRACCGEPQNLPTPQLPFLLRPPGSSAFHHHPV